MPKDVEKAKSLLSEAAEKGSTRANGLLGQYYLLHAENTNCEEARRWFEASAADGEMFSFYQLGMMMHNGQAFDQNEQTRAEEFRLLTISATLFQGPFNLPAMHLSSFFRDSLPVMLYYLRPIVEEGNASLIATAKYGAGLFKMAIEYYGKDVIFAAGHCPVPETLFWHRRSSRKEVLFVRLERVIREQCAHCRADLLEGNQSCCVECRAAYYCSRNCQVAHWKAGHKKDCVKKLKKKLKAAGEL